MLPNATLPQKVSAKNNLQPGLKKKIENIGTAESFPA